MPASSNARSNQKSRLERKILARQREIREIADQKIAGFVDQLTGGVWKGTYEDSLYDDPETGLRDYMIDADRISIKFTRTGRDDSTFVADRIINYDGQAYAEKWIGSVSPSGAIVMNSLSDTDILLGSLDRKSGTLSLLFFDDGTYIFNDISKLYSSEPLW
jgi:hypothetical protein